MSAKIRFVSDQDHLQIQARQEPDRLVLSLSGELDLLSVPLLKSKIEGIQSTDGTIVVLDLQAVKFIDSTGLRAILSARELLHEQGVEFAVTPGSPQVQRLLSLTRIEDHLRVVSSADEMLV